MKFDPKALTDAVDAERRARGLTWAALSRQVHVSTSTIKGMADRRWGVELDGVLGLTRWLGRTVESFAGGDGGPAPNPADFRPAPPFLRFDTRALHAAVDKQREERGITWNDAAREIWPDGPWGADQLKKLAKGGRTDVSSALAIVEWLGATISAFTRLSMQ
jgi:hypothetical protein